jgi:multidrug efflux system outer membrane protein
MRRCSVALLACACSVAPKYERPAVDLPVRYRFADQEADSLANVKWWNVFRDPELQGLVREALLHNPDVRIAAARVDELRGLYGVARAAQFPQVQLTADVVHARASERGAAPIPPGVSPVGTLYNASAEVTYQTDFWGQFRGLAAEARANLLAQEEARSNVVLSVVTSVAQAYFQLRELDLELEITRRTVASFEDSLRLTRIRFEGNVASELDVRQAETALYSAQAQIPQLDVQIAQQENAISILAGRNPAGVRRGAPITGQNAPPDVPAGLPSQLLARRPDLRQAEAQLVGAFAGIGVARAQFLPQFSLTASGGFTSTALSTLLSGPALAWQLVAGLAQPIFQGGRLRANLEAAEARREQAAIAYSAALQRALADVDDALVAYHKTGEQLALQRSLVESSSAALNLANSRYTAGVSTYLEVLDAQRQLFNAELSRARTEGALLVALVRLYGALGGGWDAT